tara:strand:- start:3454 stop:4506 length:1053 start_codon:yes stop_codon:yes gene_type:complete
MFKPVMSGIAGCTFLILIDTLSEMIENIVVRGVPFLQVMELLSYQMIHLLSFTVPMGMMIGALLAYGSLSNTNEISALNSLGINLWKILRPILILGFAIFVLLILNNQFITPIAAKRQEDIAKMLAYYKPSLGLAERQFIDSIKGYSIYLDEFDGGTSTSGDFIIFANDSNAIFPNVVKGSSANWDDGYMNIRDAKAYELDEKGRKKASVEFREQKIPIRSKIVGFDFLGMNDEENQMSLTSLISTILSKKRDNLPSLRYEMTLHTKLSLCFSPIVMALLGATLATSSHKRFRKGDGKITGITVLFLYWLWIMSSRGVIISNNYPAYIMWGPNLIFLILGILLFLYKRRA